MYDKENDEAKSIFFKKHKRKEDVIEMVATGKVKPKFLNEEQLDKIVEVYQNRKFELGLGLEVLLFVASFVPSSLFFILSKDYFANGVLGSWDWIVENSDLKFTLVALPTSLSIPLIVQFKATKSEFGDKSPHVSQKFSWKNIAFGNIKFLFTIMAISILPKLIGETRAADFTFWPFIAAFWMSDTIFDYILPHYKGSQDEFEIRKQLEKGQIANYVAIGICMIAMAIGFYGTLAMPLSHLFELIMKSSIFALFVQVISNLISSLIVSKRYR